MKIRAENGWSLVIMRDGAAVVQETATGIGNTLRVPASTFDFDAVCRELTAKVKPTGKGYAIAFFRNGSNSATAVYLNDHSYVLGLFAHAIDPAIKEGRFRGRAEEFDRAWREKPPSMISE